MCSMATVIKEVSFTVEAMIDGCHVHVHVDCSIWDAELVEVSVWKMNTWDVFIEF